MKRLPLILFGLIFHFSIAQTKETFDLATYTVPAGWKKTVDQTDVTGYAITNEARGSYCQIAIYRGTASSGNADTDFKNEWKALVDMYKPKSTPEMSPPERFDGWVANGGAAPFTFEGVESVAMLVTMSGHGRCMSIVVLTNTDEYQPQIEAFLSSVTMQKPVIEQKRDQIAPKQNTTASSTSQPSVPAQAPKKTRYTYNTTTFDDGWVAKEMEDWVEVTKGNLKVLVHYPNKEADEYRTDLDESTRAGWNILVAPRYSNMTNFELKPIHGWQSIDYAEADLVENATGKPVHVVLFKYNYSGGGGKFLEFITSTKKEFEDNFKPWHNDPYGWEKVEAMADYNKFAVAPADLNGTWSNNYSGYIGYVNSYTGLSAGGHTHGSSTTFEFSNDTYKWEIAMATNYLGSVSTGHAKSAGKYKVVNNWEIYFSDIQGKPKTYSAYFTCIKGARLLWLQSKDYPGWTSYGRKN